MNLRGHIDRVAFGHVEGWIAAGDEGQDSVAISLMLDDAVIWQGLADRYRPDLHAFGIGAGRHGFSIPIPAAFQDGKVHRAQITTPDGAAKLLEVPCPLEIPTLHQFSTDDIRYLACYQDVALHFCHTGESSPALHYKRFGEAEHRRAPTSIVPLGAWLVFGQTANFEVVRFDLTDTSAALALWVSTAAASIAVRVLCRGEAAASSFETAAYPDPLGRLLLFWVTVMLPPGADRADIELDLTDDGGVVLGRWQPVERAPEAAKRDGRAAPVLDDDLPTGATPVDILDRSILERTATPADIEGACRFLLGREPAPAEAVHGGTDVVTVLAHILDGAEFRRILTTCVVRGEALPHAGLSPGPDADLLAWASRRLPLSAETVATLGEGMDWRQFLVELLADAAFRVAVAPCTLPEVDDLMAPLGRLERIEGGRATGWAAHPDRDGAVTVDLVADGRIVASAIADRPRPDLSGRARQAGFSIEVPRRLADGRAHSITVRIAGWRRALRGDIGPLNDAHPVESGFFDVAADYLIGRVRFAAGEPSRQKLLLEVDGQASATIDLMPPSETAPAGSDSTFSHLLSYQLADGKPHLLRLRLLDSPAYLVGRGGQPAVRLLAFIRSRIDQFSAGRIAGWAVDVRRPDDPCLITVYDRDRQIGEIVTSERRSDVNRALAISGSHGFAFDLPATLYDGRLHDIRLRVGGELIYGGRGPAVLARDAGRPGGERWIGRVEQVDHRLVAGWAQDLGSDLPVTVRIDVDGETVGTALANNFSYRFAQHTGGNGYRGFMLRLPHGLMDGREKAVNVAAIGAPGLLQGSGQACKFPLTLLPTPAVRLTMDRRLTPADLMPRPAPVRRATSPPREADTPDVSIIVINWNGETLLENWFRSFETLRPALAYEIIVVDHGSTDGSAKVVAAWAQRLPIRFEDRRANYSFSESNNHAARLARGRTLLFANNDLEFTEDIITTAIAHLDDEAIGIVGFSLLEPLPAPGGGWTYTEHHIGVTFESRVVKKGVAFIPREAVQAEFQGVQAGTRLPAPGIRDFPVVTAALLLCRRKDFLAIGGFSEAYVYGYEDVDFCLRFARHFGTRIISDAGLKAVHNRSATRARKLRTDLHLAEARFTERDGQANRMELLRTQARHIRRSVMRDGISGGTLWRTTPLRLAFAVTETHIHTAAGDYFTALELGLALGSAFRWEVTFVQNAVHNLPDVDVLVAMRYDYDLGKVAGVAPGFVAVAWIRNRVDQWIEAGRLPRYHLVFASSHKAIDEIARKTGVRAHLLPIATNAERFRAPVEAMDRQTDVLFTGNYWGHERTAVNLLDPDSFAGSLSIIGAKWDEHPTLHRKWGGQRPYYDLPDLYRTARIVIDDSHPVTRDWNSLNSRVFDATAAGCLVVTNCTGGSEEMFGGALPSFETTEELKAFVNGCLAEPERRERLARSLQTTVLEQHSYANRATVLRDTLSDFVDTLRIGIKIGVPRVAGQELWGDFHFAHALRRAFGRLGCHARVDLMTEWDSACGVADDVAIVLRGLSAFDPAPGRINMMWLISHPDAVSTHELMGFDHVFVASDSYAKRLGRRLGSRVSPLLQCTDPDRFYPDAPEGMAWPALFVGNSRGARRALVDMALEAETDFALFGSGWETTPAQPHLVDTYVPNERLRQYYSSAAMVLCDHWPDMSAEGFIANRLFDAAACGAPIVTDAVDGLQDVFGTGVTVVRSTDDLRVALAKGALDPEARQALRERVLAAHTFDHRAATILTHVRALV